VRRGRKSRPAVGAGLSEPHRTNNVPDRSRGGLTNLGHSVVDYLIRGLSSDARRGGGRGVGSRPP
jgi:hypothetical protein